MTDLCAEIMHAHLELEGKGIDGLMSRADRVALLRRKPKLGVGDEVGSVVHANPLASPTVTQNADPTQLGRSSDAGASAKGDRTSQPAVPDALGIGDSGEQGDGPGEEPLTTLEQCLWFTTAAGQMSPWTAMGAFSAVFKKVHGNSILLELNTAYFVPALPTLMLAMFFIPRFDSWLGHSRGYMARVGLCQTIISISVMLFPLVPNAGGKELAVAVSVIIGLIGALGYGTIWAFNSMHPSRASSIFSMGLFAPGFLFMALHAITQFSVDFPPNAAKKQAHWFFGGIMGLVGVISFMFLLLSARGQALCTKLDAESAADEEAKAAASPSKGALLGTNDEETGVAGGEVELSAIVSRDTPDGKDVPTAAAGATDSVEADTKPGRATAAAKGDVDAAEGRQASMQEVLGVIWPSLASIFISIIAIVSITSFFTAAPSSDPALPATLFYVKNGCDFAGRAFTLLPPLLSTQRQLLMAVVVRFVACPLFFIYVYTEALGRSDGFLIALIGISAVVSGYLNTICYQLASKAVNTQQRSSASMLMNMAFQASLLASIGLSFAIISVAP